MSNDLSSDETEYAKQQAQAQLESIREMLAAVDTDDEDALEAARQTIQEDPLSVQVRSCWYTPGATGDDISPCEFEILLCTGGPAVRIIGELDMHNEPQRAWLEYQDWGTPWTRYYEPEIEAALMAYAQEFYYGE